MDILIDEKISWARAYAGSKQNPKIHAAVGEGINMRALCKKSILLTTVEIPKSMLMRMNKDDFCIHCLKALDKQRS